MRLKRKVQWATIPLLTIYGTIFIRLAVIASETREMSRNSTRIWPYSSSRSSTVIDLDHRRRKGLKSV